MSGNRISRKAFTLIELLAVLAIVAILAALLIPAVGRSMKSARQAASMSNLRTLGTAFNSYTADNGGFFPFHAEYGGFRGSYYIWQLLFPYAGENMEVFQCKADNRPFARAANVRFLPGTSSELGDKMASTRNSYSSNDFLTGGYHLLKDQFPGVPAAGNRVNVTTPGHRLVLFCESGTSAENWMSVAAVDGTMAFNSAYPAPANWHNNGSVILFYDGSASWVPTGEAPASWTQDFREFTFNPLLTPDTLP